MKIHFMYLFRGLVKVMKPGRICLVHCMNIPKLGRRKDTFDFRGFLIRLGRRAGFLYDNDWMVYRNPQSEAIRTHAHGLLFVTLEKDRSKSRAGMGEFLIKLIAPGENRVAIDSPGISRDEWTKLAAPCWHHIRQTYTLNTKEAKGAKDTRHICPFALDTVKEAIRLYSNPDEVVFDPFTGIGSTGYEAIKLERKFFGCELKPEYYNAALRNIDKACRSVDEIPASLFDLLEEDESPCQVDDDSDSISELYDEEPIDV
jgi:DNA modification methylase